MDKILKIEDIIKIAEAIADAGYIENKLIIDIGVKTQKLLNRINEDYFLRNKEEKKEKTANVDEVNVTINNIRFRYYLDDQNN